MHKWIVTAVAVFATNYPFALHAERLSVADSIDQLTSEAKGKVPLDVLNRLLEGNEQEFIVEYVNEATPLLEGVRDKALRRSIKNSAYAETKALVRSSTMGVETLTEYRALRMSHVRTTDRQAFVELLNNPRVSTVYEITHGGPALDQSLPLVEQDHVEDDGYKGDGTTNELSVARWGSHSGCPGLKWRREEVR